MPPTIYLVGAAVAVFLLIVVPKILRRSKVAPSATRSKLNLADLGTGGPPANGPQLTIVNVPVRLAQVIVAPAGRGELPPSDEAVAVLMDRILPGIAAVVKSHQPPFERWEGQLSAGGFCRVFFAHLGLDDGGKGTPWCGIAGPIVYKDHRFFAGLVLCSAQPNNVGQYIMDSETQWLDALRIG